MSGEGRSRVWSDPGGADAAGSDAAAWVAFDFWVREAVWVSPAAATAELAALRGKTESGEARLAFQLCDRDGRVREAALRQLAVAPWPVLLPLVVVRCADWVPPVRGLARELLREALPGLGAGEVAALAPLVLRVGYRDRGAYGVGLLGETLRRFPRALLPPLLVDSEREVRRFAHRVAVDERLLSPAELARAAARDSDVIVQNLCADAALAGVSPAVAGRLDEHAYDDVVSPLLGARTPRVRSAGVTALRRVGRADAARPYLVDRSALVRACARYVLRQAGTDPLPLYQEWCGDPEGPALPPGAAVGLGECGARADAELLLPLLGHPVAAVRARAVAGLRLLDVAGTERLRSLLDDCSPGVAREVCAALIPSARQLPTDWLMARIGPERPRHTRVAAFRLLCAQSRSAQLRAALALLRDVDGKLRRRAEHIVRER